MMTCKRILLLLLALAAPILGAARPPLTTYVIYHDSNSPPSVARAATELQKHLEKATGALLEIVSEPRTPMLALGESATASAAGFRAENLPWEASRIVTRGDDVFIVGRDLPDDGNTPLGGRSYGTLYGAYSFLERALGVRWLMPGEHGTHVPRQPDMSLPDLDWTEQPGMEFRQLSNICDVGDGSNWYLRHRFDQNVPLDQPRPIPPPFPREGRSGAGGSLDFRSGHAWDNLFPSENHPYAAYLDDRQRTFAKEPGYFAMARDGQRIHPPPHNIGLCLSHPGMDDEVARRVGLIMEREGVAMVSIFPTDAAPDCACQDCQARLITPDRRYFAEDHSESQWSRVVIEHYRNVAERVARTHPGKYVSGGIYYKHEVPFEGLAPLPDNFMGQMAPVRIAYGPQRLTPDYNRAWHNLLGDWQTLAPNMAYYGLDFWMRDYTGAPVPPYLDLMRDTFGTLHRLGYRGAIFYGTLGYGRGALINYMLAKLLWNPARDPEEVFVEFCDAAYGAGAKPIKQLYLVADQGMRAFFLANIQDKIHYNVYPELLRDVYGAAWPEIEARYLEALRAVQGDTGARWRLERLGDNLKLLYYHLTRLDLAATNTNSPLYMTEAQSREFNRSDRRRAPWPVVPIFANLHVRDALAPVQLVGDAPAPQALGPVGPFRLRYHQDVLIVPDRDGPVTVELNFETGINRRTGAHWLPDIPYYTLYDLDLRQGLANGIAEDGGRRIRFAGEKGRSYVLIISATGRYLSETRYGIGSIDAPWALGSGVDPLGVRFYQIDTPLYFYVPAGIDTFQLHFRGGFEADVLDPAGNVAAAVECIQATSVTLDASAAPAGFWALRFRKPPVFPDFLVRQDPRLSGYFTVDPSVPLAIRKPEKK